MAGIACDDREDDLHAVIKYGLHKFSQCGLRKFNDCTRTVLVLELPTLNSTTHDDSAHGGSKTLVFQ